MSKAISKMDIADFHLLLNHQPDYLFEAVPLSLNDDKISSAYFRRRWCANYRTCVYFP